jgi:hypothetical protein
MIPQIEIYTMRDDHWRIISLGVIHRISRTILVVDLLGPTSAIHPPLETTQPSSYGSVDKLMELKDHITSEPLGLLPKRGKPPKKWIFKSPPKRGMSIQKMKNLFKSIFWLYLDIGFWIKEIMIVFYIFFNRIFSISLEYSFED